MRLSIMATLMAALLAACGEAPKSEGFVSENNLCRKPDFSASLDAYPQTRDLMQMPGTLRRTPTLAQSFSTGASNVPLWGFALRLAAPTGTAAGDIEFFVYDGDTAPADAWLGSEIASFAVDGDAIGRDESWVEAQLDEVVTLRAYSNFWIAAYTDYAPDRDDQAAWATIDGAGLYRYEAATQAWTAEDGRAGVMEIPCQRGEL